MWIFGDNIARYLSLILENDFRRLSKMFINRIYYTSIEFNIFLNVYNIFALIEFISQQFILKLRKNKTTYSLRFPFSHKSPFRSYIKL